jgi:hypothetical protein
MVKASRNLAALKQWLVCLAVVSLAVAASLVVSGTLKAEGMHIFLSVTLATYDTSLGLPLGATSIHRFLYRHPGTVQISS